ncbi:hypothetical protein GETHLI_26340 [Geothrix limicola]|uniref:Pvc16 N-terminal domain-containing protein n=1 Tax=Geothrix limicola TaxID=2927978 RepID=A0ABQ5QHR3_9BACT|nr:DUF4255 domain-containing protein [Geothrix limicola]GLH74132.1 hypothetical protein GETHLI_26340 [Geothrix limicola]
MSNSLAIAAVTATLRNLLDTKINASVADDPSTDPGLAGTGVTTKALDKARTGSGNQVNLFLYQTAVNAAWQNMDLPQQTRPNEQGRPPLALVLHYLVTAYGAGEDDQMGHRLLGRSMSVLYDHALLGPSEIQAALAGNDLAHQVERVRISPLALSVEEISKLWTVFQTPYRISAAYQVSAVLIDSNAPTKAALPVLKRGQDNRGVASQTSLDSPYPNLTSLGLPANQPSVRLGQTVQLLGAKLGGTAQGILLQHSRWEAPIEVPAAGTPTDTEIDVVIPPTPAAWPAGLYLASALVQRPSETTRRTTNQLPLMVAPVITSALPLSTAVGATLSLSCSPDVLPAQRVSLFVGDREVPAQPHPAQTSSLDFALPADLSGTYFLRLRVDGIDSQLVQDYTAANPAFDPLQKVTLS